MCEICQNWERVEDPYKIRTRKGLPVLTNHHPNCPHYNDSLMDVWKVSCHGSNCYLDNEKDAEQAAETEGSGDTVAIVKTKMHREVFENLPEFDGF